MAFDAPGALAAVVAVLDGLGDLQEPTAVGVPATIASRVTAFVTLGGATLVRKTVGRIDFRRLRVRIWFAYRVQGAPTDAEQRIARLVDALTAAVERDPTLGVPAVVVSSTFAGDLADAPEYADVAGVEHRLWPCLIEVTQTATFANP